MQNSWQIICIFVITTHIPNPTRRQQSSEIQSIYFYWVVVSTVGVALAFEAAFICAAIRSRSRWPWEVSLRPPLGAFSTSFKLSRVCRALRATAPELLQKCEGAVPRLWRAKRKQHRLRDNTEWQDKHHYIHIIGIFSKGGLYSCYICCTLQCLYKAQHKQLPLENNAVLHSFDTKLWQNWPTILNKQYKYKNKITNNGKWIKDLLK